MTASDSRRIRSDWRCSVRCLSASAQDPATRWEMSAETADATASVGVSDAVYAYDLGGVRPIFGSRNESRTHGILEDVFPFCGVALVAPQQVIVKARLPKRDELLQRNSRGFIASRHENSIEISLQAFDPLAQCNCTSNPEAHE